MSLNFWPMMIKKDSIIINCLNKVYHFTCLFKFKQQRLLKETERQFKGIFKRENLFIVLNGPSVSKQNLNDLKGKNVMFTNRGFMHPLYKDIKPRFHVFVDPKMLTGEWSVGWLDEIIEMVPGITFVMPVHWAFIDKFKPYIDKGVSFMWIPMYDPLKCLGVSGYCFRAAISLGFENIYFTGFDGNGLAYELVNHGASHFYGVNAENLTKTTVEFTRDLYMNSRHFNDLNVFAASCKKKQIHIYNITHGGIIDMFERRDWDAVLGISEQKE